jgi:glycerophosphoryl diester phosphodiesterase
VTSPFVIAHRTCPPLAPENSITGLRIAVEQGAHAVEIDLRVSLDLHPFLMHDNSMHRTTGWLLPIELTPAFLVRRRRLEGTDEVIPDLDAAYNALPGDRLMAVDVKTPWAVVQIVRYVKRHRLEQRTLAWCSSARAAGYILHNAPGVEVAHYKDYEDVESNRGFIEGAAALGVQAVSLDWRAIDAALVAYAHERGLKVYSWHKEYELSRDKLSAGLDGLITDYPARALAALSAGK